MEIKCFLCSEPIEVKATKKGLPFIYCQNCKTRMFVSTPLAIEALNALTIDGEEFSDDLVAPGQEPYNPHPPGRSSNDHGASVVEIKKLGERIASLEKAIGKGKTGKTSSSRGKKIKVWRPQK
ncbi:hypothetical protein ES703_48182 [subsurface metagenome]